MNPRAAINDLHPFQGCLFNLLSTSPKQLNSLMIFTLIPRGEDGIRTHAPLRTNGFQDRLVMTTSIPLHSHALNQRKNYISKIKIISQQKIVPEDKNFSAISKSSDVVIFMFEYEPSVMCTVTFE